MYHRSPGHGKFIKLMTIYARSCRLAAKAYDTFHACGLLFSQNWTLKILEQLSVDALTQMMHDIHHHANFAGSDNINIGYTVAEQRLDNRDHFDSGAAATVYIVKNMDDARPDPQAYRQQKLEGQANMLTEGDVQIWEDEASDLIDEHHISLVLQELLQLPMFSAYCKEHKEHAALAPAQPVRELRVGKEFRTKQYILPAQHQEVQSQEGNDKAFFHILKEYYMFSDENADNKKAIAKDSPPLIWVGDQLTVQRLRNITLQRAGEYNKFDRYGMLVPLFGWLHARMAFGNSLHKQYFGDSRESDYGLGHIFDRLNRKHLYTTSTQGTFYHTLEKHSLMRALPSSAPSGFMSQARTLLRT
jgi:hypothetical protein